MKDLCRICGRELCGNQRRWLFHPATRLQVLLSHALGWELRRDGRGEFACGKCVFMLERMYRFDTVIARVEALSVERLQRLLLEKERLRQCIGGMYRKHNDEAASAVLEKDCTVDMSGLHYAKYCALLQEDLMYSMYESWAEDEEQTLECGHSPQCQGLEARRRCRGCSALRVADSDYEAVCKVPRKLARSISCGPSTRYSASVGGSVCGEEPTTTTTVATTTTTSATLVPDGQPRASSDSDRTVGGKASSSNSVESLTMTLDAAGEMEKDGKEEQNSDTLSEEHSGPHPDTTGPAGKLALALCLVQNFTYKPVRIPRGSKLPVLVKTGSLDAGAKLASPEQALRNTFDGAYCELEAPELPRIQLDPGLELAELEEMWDDAYVEYMPFRLQKVPKESLIEEQQSQLNQYESAAGQCVSELQKAQLQVQSLQNKIQESEVSNKKLQGRLSEMETELRSIRQAAQSQERTIQSLTESLTTKETEAQELYQVIEGQNTTMCKLREMAHHNQLQHTQTIDGAEAGSVAQLQGDIVGLQSSLFCSQLQLEASQRAHRQSQRVAEDLEHARLRLCSDLEAALQHRETTEKHNQDLRSTVQQLRSEQQVKEAQLKEGECDKHSEVAARDKTISQLQLSLREKEKLLQEYSELLDQPADPSRPQDVLLDKLKRRIRDRDKALERAIDEKFHCLEEKESEVRRLQLALREKERDLERLRCILSNNEETLTSLDALVRGKELELEQTQEACRKLQWLKQQCDEKHTAALRERDNIITQLHSTLHTRSKETEDLTAALMAKVIPGPNEVVEELRSRLALKERLFQELLSDRSRQTQEHHIQVQGLLNTISSRDQYIKENGERLRQVIAERTCQLQELHRQLSSQERELSELSRERERERERGAPLATEMERLQSLLREKESLIQDLMQGQEEAMATSRPAGGMQGLEDSSSELEIQALKEELQIALRKQREAERELSELRSALAKHHEDRTSSDQENALVQLVLEYQQLNQALRAEKKVYQNLSYIQTRGDSSADKTRALHTELDTVQALRGQLEEVLSRTRDTALALDRAAKAQAEYGDYSTDETEDDDDEDAGSSSEEFTDSIEDDDVKLTAESLAKTQNAAMSGGPVSRGLSQGAMVGGQENEMEPKKKGDREMGEGKSQLSQAGSTTLCQNSLQETNGELQQSGIGSGSGLESGSGPRTEREECRRCRRWEQSDADRLNLHSQAHTLGEEEEDEYEDEDEEGDEEDVRAPQRKRGPPAVTLREGMRKRKCMRPHSLDLGALLAHNRPQDPAMEREVEGESGGSSSTGGGGSAGFWQHVEAGLREQAERLRSDLALSRQESRELRERLMVSEATVHAQAEQLKDYRELLTESAVQQDSKQVQVDLQDLGYETSGRSENEAEREETSSPEFDDLEMCTSLSRQPYVGGGKSWGWHGDSGGSQLDDPSSLHCLVQDLRAQLSRCHKVIRGLQLRVRSLSATSDYASSLERTPRKVNWAFQASPAHSAVEEDEGWQSDGPVMGPLRSRKELQELVSRVASLENQIRSSSLEGKGGAEDGKNATWPGKYNTLIQAQARELSHLRQRMREGRGICHILTQHLGDTTKAFEELLRANDIDYYMGQSFREQLSQSSSLAQRISIKISGRDRSELQDDKMGHELLALRLSKELQQKDKIIESLHTKLQQRPETPSSSHAPSETTDQSDRTSFVSDERGSTNEDLELCSDVDAVSEYAQETAPTSNNAAYPSVIPAPRCIQSPFALYRHEESKTGVYSGPLSSSLPLSQTHHWSNSSNSLTFDPLPFPGSDPRLMSQARPQQGLHRPPVRSFSLPHSLSSYPLMGPTALDSSSYTQLSHHSLHQPQKTESSLVGSSALWGTENMVQPIRGFPGVPGYSSGNSQSGVDLIEEHLCEIRTLRQRLEDSIRTNERLRQQLEGRLATTARDTVAPTNIYIQGLDTVTQLSNEIRVLKEENMSLQSRLQASRDSSKEMEQLREAVLSGRARLKQAELEAEQWKEELRRLQAHSCEQSQQIQQLRQERQSNQEHSNRLQHEVSLLQQQLSESRQLLHSLQCELQLYDRVCAGNKSSPAGYLSEILYPSAPAGGELGELLVEVRALRGQMERSVQENGALRVQLQKQLEQQLSSATLETRPSSLIPASPLRDAFYRRQLLHDPSPSPPVRDVGPFPAGPPYSPYSELEESSLTANDSLEPHAELEGEAPDGSFANRNGRHAIGHVDDFSALQQQVLEGRGLVQRMEATLQTCLNSALLEVNAGKALDYASVRTLLANTKTLRQILEEAASLLKMFWRAALPSTDGPAHLLQKEQSMKEEIQSLRLKIAEQEEVLQNTIQRLRSTSRTKESMETFIVSQLSRTRDVLKKARANLEKNELRISSLSCSSSSLCHGKVLKGAYPGSSDWGGVTPEIAMETASPRLPKKRGRECLLQAV
ncbi:myomegalin-like isoform X1 [Pygocentrus nattereri]|uniref:myomegalin-like isoform X1 n=1 Tax=Pygocentrus nattereri TaxID=42514 RepID=UPI0018919D56|nr:myomegalin-like isoform X1 [Pygocentrus nattereri]